MANMRLSSLSVQLAFGGVIAAIVIYSLRHSNIEWTYVIVPAAELAVTPHAVFYDPTLLLVPLWIVVDSIPKAQTLRRISIALAGPCVFIASVPRSVVGDFFHRSTDLPVHCYVDFQQITTHPVHRPLINCTRLNLEIRDIKKITETEY